MQTADGTTVEVTDPSDTARPAPVDVRAEDGGLRLVLAGTWIIETATASEDALEAAMASVTTGTVVIDGSRLARMDTAGAWLVERARRRLAEAGATVRLEGFSPAETVLVGAVEGMGREAPPPVRKVNPVRRMLVGIGKGSHTLTADVVAVLAVLGEFIVALFGALLWRRRMRWPAFVNHIQRSGLEAVPIVALMSFLIGMIIAQQGAFYFRTYGAELFVVDLVGVLVCREIGVLLTSIMVAGRSGSAFTAEIGSMKMREEIDALVVLGVSPVDVLVVPRLLGLVVAVPILTLISDLAALAGTWVIVVLYIGLPTDTFFLRLQEALSLSYVVIGLAKAPAMALIIGLVACVEGMKVEGSAESLGEHTTASVVKAIFMVIVMDGVFAMFFGAVGI